MPDEDRTNEAPLSAEARKREEWRGEARILQGQDVTGHTLPESERDEAAEVGERHGSAPAAGIVAPPD